MKGNRIYFFIGFLFLIILFSACHKDYSFEGGESSKGSLKDISGICLPQQLTDSFIAGKSFTDSSFIFIKVRVIQTGSYEISSDSVNGFSFKTNGFFSDTGIQVVKLKGIGKPIQAGNNIIMITYDSTTCPVNIKILQDPNAAIANFTLTGAPNICMSDTIGGVYVKDQILNDKNIIKVSVNVISPGKYTIITNLVNGYSFSATGTFTATGTQTVILKGIGVPIGEGTDVFTITAALSSCSLSIKVEKPVLVNNADHFPLTLNSTWSYDDILNTPDTIFKSINGSKILNGNVYRAMKKSFRVGPPEDFFYRKTDTSYYEYGSVDKYTVSLQFVPQINGEILFLKENLKTGETWESDEYSGPITFGQVIFLKYFFTCKDSNAIVTLNGKTFINVYIIQMQPKLHASYTTWDSTGEDYLLYYAKGIGLIYSKKTIVISGVMENSVIRNWMVN